MTGHAWTEKDTERVEQFWAAYQQTHDVSEHLDQAVGIDPASGEVWFGETALDIVRQRRARGLDSPLFFLRVGSDHYLRKGTHR